jgi:CPA2 family monovalent cation:H+ antiporter-2
MGHLPNLIVDLALILLTGAIVTILFKSIKQPVVLGYILAGVLVGPYLSIIPTVTDSENIRTLAEIGIIFLLFSLGLEFNIKKIQKIGGSASITALIEIVFISLAGFIMGQLMKWSIMDSIFIGAMLASSSTTIIIKAFDDLGIKTRPFARIVFGVLIIEDIVVILLLVLLPTIAITRQFEGTQLLITIAKLIFFLILMVIIGLYILPTFVKKARNFLNEETLLILSVGLCLGMVVLATRAGFSAELGAFIMGFILAETSVAEKVEHVTKPVKDLFAAVFFVSIGMMIDPSILLRYGGVVAIVTFITIFGKLISTSLGALLSGQSPRQSFQIGMSMAQIGEFAFIVATLGLSLGVISDFLFPVAVGASAITTFTTPYMIKYSDKLYQWIQPIIPAKWISFLDTYSTNMRKSRTEKVWKTTVKSYLIRILTNTIIIIALSVLSIRYISPLVHGFIRNELLADLVILAITFLFIAPFLWGLMAKRSHDIAYRELWINNKYNRGPLIAIELVRVIIGLLLIGFLINEIFSTLVSAITIMPVIVIVLIIFSKRIRFFYQRMERRLVSNIGSNSTTADMLRVNPIPALNLSPWDVQIVEMEVDPNALYIGKTLEQLAWREQFGVNIAYIKRAGSITCFPTRDSQLFPTDKVGIIGSDEQLKTFQPEFSKSDNMESDTEDIDIVVKSIEITDKNRFIGQTIRDSGLREKTNGLVLGIERKNERILNPVSTTVFEKDDIIWLAADRTKIREIIDFNTSS